MKEKILKCKKQLIVCGIVVVFLIAAIIVLIILLLKQDDEKAMESFDRQRRNAVSDTIELEGTVSVGTKSQTFTLDIAAFSGQSFEWNSGGDMFSGSMGGGAAMLMAGNTAADNSSSETRQLDVEEVYVQVGQQITAGDPILKVSQSSLDQLRADFETDADEAKNIYDQALTSQQQTENEAALSKAENELYGAYADIEYTSSLLELNEAVETIQENIDTAKEEITLLQEEIVTLQADLTVHQTALNNAIYARDAEEAIDNPYGWLTAETTRLDLEEMIDTANDTIESNAEEIETLLKEVETLNLQLASANYALEKGTIEAESEKQIRSIKAENAQEIYDVTVSLAEFTTQNALEDYEEAQEKLDILDSYLPDGCLLAENDGVVTSVSVAVGDNLTQNLELISVNNYEAVTITLSVDETDMEAASLGSEVQIEFAAYPDEIFSGEVTNIGDAEMDSDTNTTVYEVEITIDAEEGSKLYEGMTAIVTLTRPQNAMKGSVSRNGMSAPSGRGGGNR